MGKSKYFHIEVLKQTLDDRQQRNKQYSLRAFAQDLDLDHSYLSKVLNKKKFLSLSHAKVVADRLSLGSDDTELFFVSVSKHHQCRSLSKLDKSLTIKYCD